MADLCTKFTLSGCHRFYPQLPDHWYDLVEAPARVTKFTPRKKHNRAYRSRHGHIIIGFAGADEDVELPLDDNGVEAEEQPFEDNGLEPIAVNEVEEVAIDVIDVPELGIEHEAELEQVEDDDEAPPIAVNEVEEVAIDVIDVPELGIEHEELEQVEDDDEVPPIDGGEVPEEFTEYEGGIHAAKFDGENNDKAEF